MSVCRIFEVKKGEFVFFIHIRYMCDSEFSNAVKYVYNTYNIDLYISSFIYPMYNTFKVV